MRFHYDRHSHPTFSIGVIESGVGGNTYRGSTYLAPTGSLVLMNPGEVHTGYCAGEVSLTYRMIYLDLERMQSIAAENNIQRLPYFREALVTDNDLFQQMCYLLQRLEQSTSQLERDSLLLETLSILIGQYKERRILPPTVGQELGAIAQLKAYFEAHYDQDISLQTLVTLTGLSRSYLIRLFRQTTGLPPYLYLTQVRLEKAKQRLARGESVKNVAAAVGFADQSHLTRYFKRIYGMTPAQYRQMATSFKTT